MYTFPALALMFINFRMKVPALVCAILSEIFLLIEEFGFPEEAIDFHYLLGTLYYSLEYILVIVYVLVGERRRNHFIWMLLWVLIVINSIIKCFIEGVYIMRFIFLILYILFYLAAYSPFSWNRRKKDKDLAVPEKA